MLGLRVLLLLPVIGLASFSPISVRADLLTSAPAPGSACDNWEQQCARLYGPRTKRWFACMDQPRAKYDCQDAGGYAGVPPPDNPLCDNWSRECARFYGSGTRKYGQCMRQPQARADCGR
jgi:hypothetical protein